MNDILDDDMKMVFKDCKKEGLSRILIYLYEFKKPEIVAQASFKRADIPLMEVWVAGQKEEQRKEEKTKEKFWNLAFVIIGAFIGAFVTLSIAKIQLGNLNQQHAEAMKQTEKSLKQTRDFYYAENRPIPAIKRGETYFSIANYGNNPLTKNTIIAKFLPMERDK